MIDISYTPVENYQPPYYRAASSVTLTCRAVGASGQIRYRWSSTCSNCFVLDYGSYYRGYSISQSFLRSHDAGTHTCSVYDSRQRISGSASTVMMVVGECFSVPYHPSTSSNSLPLVKTVSIHIICITNMWCEL